MKANKILLLIAFIFLFLKNEIYSQAPTNGLIAYYPFIGNANDGSGNGRNGVLSGGVTSATDRFGNPNQAYAFNGSNGSIDVNNWNILTGNSPRTMMVWFKMTLPNTISQYFLAWGPYGNSASSVIGAFTDSRYNIGFTGYANDLWVTNQFQFYDNQWHLMAVTFDGNNLSIYLDGVIATSKTTTLNTSSTKLTIGNRLGTDFFNGSLDEVRIYNRALTSNEVQQTYLTEAPTTSTAEVIKLGADRLFSTLGIENTYIGLRSGAFANGAGSTFLGQNTGLYNTGNHNTFLGSKTGEANSSGFSNSFIGHAAGNKNTTGASNSFLGMYAGLNNTIGSNNTFTGRSAGEANTSGSNDTYIGHAAGLKSTTSSDNAFLGFYAGSENTTGINNTYLGSLAGQFNILGNSNTFIGYAAGLKNTNSENVFIGRGSGAYTTTGTYNTYIGVFSGLGVESTPNVGSYNTFMGYKTGFKNTTGQNNVLIGWSSGSENTTGTDNTASGTQAGGLTTTGSYNTSFGKLAGYFNITGSLNTYLGAGADGFGVNKGNLSNATAIGANAKVSISDAIVLGDTANVNLNVGIGTTRPTKRLEVRSPNANASGIRLTNLTANSPTTLGNNKALSVNNLGDLILVPMIGGSGINTHSDSAWVRISANTNFIGGNVGIGVSNPQEKLDVGGSINIRSINGNRGAIKYSSVNFIRGYNNFNGAFGFDSEVDTNVYYATAIGYKAYASASNVLVLGGVKENAAKVGIGNTAPKDNLEITSGKEGKSGLMFTNLNSETAISTNTNHVLSVDKMGRVGLYGISAGNIQLKVNSENDWSDKVFSPNYKLMSIGELEKYVQNNQHLPNIPSATEMKEKGISVQSISAKILGNVEEIILYLIEMKKEFEVVKEKVIHLENENRDLKKALKRKK